MIYAGVPSFLGLESEDGHVPTFWLLLYKRLIAKVGFGGEGLPKP